MGFFSRNSSSDNSGTERPCDTDSQGRPMFYEWARGGAMERLSGADRPIQLNDRGEPSFIEYAKGGVMHGLNPGETMRDHMRRQAEEHAREEKARRWGRR